MSTTAPEHVDTRPNVDPLAEMPTFKPAGNSSSSGRGRKVMFAVLIVCGVGLLFGAVSTMLGEMSTSDQPLVLYTVRRGDLPIIVTESGELESQKKTRIKCELESVSFDRGSNNGTQILSIVPNGTFVKEGELLVEFDKAAVQERLDQQVLTTEKALLGYSQAVVKYENQITQNETLLEEAKLQVKLAELALKQFEDESGGTFQLSLQDVELAIQQAQAERLIAATDLRGFEELYKLGYKSKGDLASAQLKSLGADRKLAREISDRKMKVEYEYLKTKLELEGKHATAGRSLLQVERDNKSMLEQARASRDSAERTLNKEKEREAKFGAQIEKCTIYAPHDGMATYAPPSRYSPSIHEGAMIRQRQDILTLPVLSSMQVETSVHEAMLDQIKEGLPVTIKVEASGDRQFRGSVKSVAVLAERGEWHSSSIKVYKTIVTIDEKVDSLKPGMTAVVDIHVDRLKDVISVPVQAIVQIGGDSWIYVQSGSTVERRLVVPGRTNDKFVEIKEGLKEGEQVALNPMSIVDESTERENAISPEGDAEEIDFEGTKQEADAKPEEDAERKPKAAGGAGQRKPRKEARGGSVGSA